jgi:hypothetical protein
MKNKDDLFYDLIFGEKEEYTINISDYLEELYKYDRFIDEVKSILKKSKVSVMKERLELSENGPIWILKVKK